MRRGGAGAPSAVLTSLTPAIGFGCLLAYALHHPQSFARLHPLLGNAGAGFALLAAVAVPSFEHTPHVLDELPEAALVALACFGRVEVLEQVPAIV